MYQATSIELYCLVSIKLWMCANESNVSCRLTRATVLEEEGGRLWKLAGIANITGVKHRHGSRMMALTLERKARMPHRWKDIPRLQKGLYSE